MKKCISCHKEKDLIDFYAHKQMADGHLNKCKECCKYYESNRRKISDAPKINDAKRYYTSEKRKQQTRNSSKKWNEKNPGVKVEKQREYRKNNPEKYIARTAVRNAIKNGFLKKGKCFVCNSENTHAHHHDYSKPLDVVWLCSICHGIEHRKYKTL